MRGLLRQIRGALGNAVLWATSWFVASFGFWSALHLFGFALPMSDPWLLILSISASSAVSGFVTGAAFSAYLRIVYWDQPLLDLKVARLALGGAGIAGGVSLAANALLAATMGLSLPLATLMTGLIWPALLGGLTAGASVRVAQHASRRLTGAAADELESEQREALRLLGDGPT